MGDHIEKIDGESLVGCRHYEVTKTVAGNFYIIMTNIDISNKEQLITQQKISVLMNDKALSTMRTNTERGDQGRMGGNI